MDKIYVVDFDGVFEGWFRNFEVVERIIEEIGLRV